MSENDLNYQNGFVEDRFTIGFSKTIIVRHGESIANAEGVYQGQTYDTDLSELGLKQAKALANKARGLGIKRIVASPLKRTYQTALEVARELDLSVEVNTHILETNHGEWEGKSKAWIEKKHGQVYQNWLRNPAITYFPGGETFRQTFERVNKFLDETLLKDTLVVTHDNIVRIMAILADGLTLNDIWKYEIEPAALNFFEVNIMNGKNKLKVLKLNETEHLRGIRADLKRHAL